MAEIRTLDDDVEIIRALDDNPNAGASGLSALQLKMKFDEAARTIKAYINDKLIPDIKSYVIAEIVSPTGRISGENIDSNSIGARHIIDKIINAHNKIADGTITHTEIGTGEVYQDNIADGAISYAKLRQVTGSEAVGPDAIRASAVTEAKIANGSITHDKIADGTITPEKTTGFQTAHKAATATLASDQTSWSVSVTGVTASSVVICTPAPASYDNWNNYGVRCTGQSAGTLTFTSLASTPAAITVNVLILD